MNNHLNKSTLYIGEFPPPYGGVTVKNLLLKKYIFNTADVNFINLYLLKRNPIFFLWFGFLMIYYILSHHEIVVGIGSLRLAVLLKLMKLFGKRALARCSVIMMGGVLHLFVAKDIKLKATLLGVKRIYTESDSFKNAFDKMNFTNVITFPNCREIHKSIKPRKTFACQPIKLLYFSKICKEKGVPQLIDMAKQLNDNDIKFTLDFYGAIDYCYKKEFDLECLRVSNVRYMGVFDVYKHNVYTKLNEYDLLLFPSIWLGEGVAGILVESKIAGIPAVVSNHNVNSEVVIDGQEGIIINGDLAKGFAESVQKLSLDREELFRLANGAFISRKRYDINLYKSSFRE